MQQKIDCTLTLESQQQRLVASNLKTGGLLKVVPDHASGTLAFLTGDQQPVAEKDGTDSAQLLAACFFPCKGTLRSLKRDPASQQVVEVTVRVLPGEAWPQPEAPQAAQPVAAAAPVIDDLDEEQASFKLSRDKLEALTANSEVVQYLRNQQLQQVIREVDSAPDMERALKQALVNPEFASFCSKVLDVVSPADQGPSS